MNSLPRWYVPKGQARPRHIPVTDGVTLEVGHGPDQGGGTLIGGSWNPPETGWLKTDGGWWIHLRDVCPQTLARLDNDPRIVRWALVAGSVQGHYWRVPVLLTPELNEKGDAVLYRSALDQQWVDGQWTDAGPLAALQQRLKAVALDVGANGARTDGELVALVGDLLALGHDLHPHELNKSGWLTMVVLLRVLIAAADVPLPEVADG